ncbi:GGDEF domain-containing protein [Dactylosporangium siamense]|uniref:GGDEF domain-containing protein n=1 Tax=Dactylosporangium siamense TaxID=685454 RepID=A0A919PK53_9ACTN|nr:GGDEF domain-containing protein [Dactylosporangium siamense]GIG45002.1 hypothetical protein Dsi01nite_030430 [Dactylosporangium siamense]
MHRFLSPATAFTVGFVLGRASIKPALHRLREAYTDAAYRADHEALTGLPNRAAAHRYDHANSGRPWAVLLVDLDDFKAVNDRHGHHAGDAMLVEIANRLRTAAHTHHGRPFRLAGDEFLVQLPADQHLQAGVNAVYNAATADLPSTLADYVWRGIQMPSFGLADASGLSWAEVLRRADIALYQAKLHGDLQTYQPGMYHPPTPPSQQRRTRLRNLPGED